MASEIRANSMHNRSGISTLRLNSTTESHHGIKVDGSIGIGTFTTTQRNAGVGTARGTMVFNTTTDAVEIYTDGNEWKTVASVRGSGPGAKSDYPIQPSNIAVFTSIWPASPSDLPTSHANSTWTAPANAVEARVIVIGAAPHHPAGAPRAGKAAVVDALIPVTGGASYKCIVGETGGGARPSGGGNGIGGGPGTCLLYTSDAADE